MNFAAYLLGGFVVGVYLARKFRSSQTQTVSYDPANTSHTDVSITFTSDTWSDIRDLEAELMEAVDREDYEMAALLRDNMKHT